MYGNVSTDANILFDEGSQRSFITEELTSKLEVKVEGSETLSIVAFGDEAKGVRDLDKTTVRLKAINGEIIPIKALIVPKIAAPLQNRKREQIQKLPYLSGLSLAHPITEAESFEISLLIGADFYWNVVQNDIVRGNGPTAVSSKIGYLLSGPVPVPNNSNSASVMNVLFSHKQEICDLGKFWKLESLGINDQKEVDS